MTHESTKDGLPTPDEEDIGPFDPTVQTLAAPQSPAPPAATTAPPQGTEHPFLKLVAGANANPFYLLDGPELVIGRSSVCGIHINRSGVSRTHARILREGSELIIEDLDSLNGTFINDQRLDGRRRLTHGDRINIGHVVTFAFEHAVPLAQAQPKAEHALPKPALATLSNLTETQVLFWMGAKLQPDVPLETQSVRFVFTISEAIERARFHRAIHELVDRADALRMIIREVEMVPTWLADQRPTFAVEDVVLSRDDDPLASLARWLDTKRKTAVSPETPFQCALVEVGPKHFVWYVALHHLIGDLRSVVLITQHVARYYGSFTAEKPDTQGEPPLPTFAEYRDHERAQRALDAYRRAGEYWSELVADIKRSCDPSWATRRLTSPDSLRTELLSVPISADETRALKERMKAARVFAPAVVFLAAFFACLASLNRKADSPLVIGTTYANRPRRFLNTIGLFVTTAPIQVRIDEEETLLSLVQKVQDEATRGSAHQHRPPAHGKIYDAFFNYLGAQFTGLGGQPMRTERLRAGYSNTSVTVSVRDFDATEGLIIDFEFRVEAFTAERRHETMANFVRALRAFIADPMQKVAALR